MDEHQPPLTDRQEELSANDTDAWLASVVAARESAYDRRRDWLSRANAEHRTAREHGLRARHAQKLARIRNQQSQDPDTA